jgi:hypothetical protein
MKIVNRLIIAITVIAFMLSGCSDRFADIERGFVSPPDDIRIGVYWYWINDNISNEAVIKDLQAMKAAGITRAYIGNIGDQSYPPQGKVRILTDEWMEVMHTALKTATELGIEMGIFNCPGWSQSGGPWITPDRSMRYLATSEVRVTGPAKITQQLPVPNEFPDFKDVKVVAMPVDSDYGQNLLYLPEARMTFATSSPDNGSSTEESHEVSGKFSLPTGQGTLTLTLPTEYTVRSLKIYTCGRTRVTAELRIKEGADNRTIKQFLIDRTNPKIEVGFDPYAPIVIALPELRSSEYTIVFSDGIKNSCIKEIVLSGTPIIERYPEKTLAKMFQSPLPYWHEYMWDAQPEIKSPTTTVARPEQVVDLTEHLSADGTLSWDVPEGEWLILRTGMTTTGITNGPTTPEGTGLEVDKMSKQHIAYHFDEYLGRIIERVPPEDRATWKFVVEDSYERGGQNFTDGFLDDFKARYGYDPVPYLPVYSGHIVGSPEMSDRFLWDIRRLIADKIAYDYVGGLREISNLHGLVTWLQNYGHWGFPGEFLQYGGQSDHISGEFWSEGELGNIENRAASSCAHIYGKPTVSAESFTCGGNAYGRYPEVMKRRGDWSFTEGINNTLLHLYIQQAHEDSYPGIDANFGNEFNRKNTWFKHIDLFITYLRRCNFMLQQGLNVADAAYFIGEDVPKMTGIRNPELPKGYSFDYINAEVILRDLTVKDGRLTLPHGTSYRVLVLPPLETMRPEVLRKIEQLVSAGAVVVGNPPSRSPSLQDYPTADSIVSATAKKIWGDPSEKQRSYGKGTIFTGVNMQEVFDLLKVSPDCHTEDNIPILYNHRTLDGKDIYFITNQSEQALKTTVSFRVTDMQPELWDATTGSIRPLPTFDKSGDMTSIPIQLESLESAFIVFRSKGRSTDASGSNYPTLEQLTEIKSPWQVTFDSDSIRRGAGTVTFDRLIDWSHHDNEQIRYYSGSAVYKNTLTITDLPSDRRLYLDLGKVYVTAKVTVNGKYVGGIWTTPYRIDVTDYLQSGDNTIEIEVINTWVNRIIGDYQLPPEQRKVTTTRINSSRTTLQSAGLIGPVTILRN